MEKFKDIQGRALLDYYLGKEDVPLILHTSYGLPERMPVEVFFRQLGDFSKLEKLALKYVNSSVLDIGAGVGSFALELQKRELPVTAIELSPLCCKIMRHRGVYEIVEDDFWNFSGGRFSTLLLMMNGIGIVGRMEKLPTFLMKLKEHLLPGGQIICDSSDISYLYRNTKKPVERYFGEIEYCYEYEREMGVKFPWLYVDSPTFSRVCKSVGLKLEVLYRNKFDQYLARIKLEE